MLTFFPLIPTCFALIILYAIAFGVKSYFRHKKRRSPFPEKFLRNPGESLRKQIEKLNVDISCYAVCIIVIPMMLYSTHISELYFRGIKESISHITSTILIGIIFISIFAVLLIKAVNKRRKLELGYDGELCVSQQLELAVHSNTLIFNDFPCDNFNIDHIVVCLSGVFSIETKARRKPVSGNGRADATVIFDGKSLKFPCWTETKPINQAVMQAKWLSAYLSKAVGESIAAQAVITLPGWYVERTGNYDLSVINPKNFPALLKKNVLSEEMIKRIAHQLDQKCRDVEPIAHYKK